jgi:hypothetical protein
VEEQVIKSLIGLYREQGIDVTAVVGDPVFASLPLPARIEMIKKYADELARDANVNITKHDIKNVLKDAAIGAGVGGFGAFMGSGSVVRYLPNTSLGTIFKPAGKIALLGAGLGAVGSALRTASGLKSRRDLHAEALKLAKNPTDENAIRMISLNTMRPKPITRLNLLEKAHDYVSKREIDTVVTAPYNSAHNSFEAAGANVPQENLDVKEHYKKLYDKYNKAN